MNNKYYQKKSYIRLNKYHQEIEERYEDQTIQEVTKTVLNDLRDYSYNFDNEIEEDWKEYYDNFKLAQIANADGILSTFIEETIVAEVPKEKLYDLTYDEVYLNKEYPEIKTITIEEAERYNLIPAHVVDVKELS